MKIFWRFRLFRGCILYMVVGLGPFGGRYCHVPAGGILDGREAKTRKGFKPLSGEALTRPTT